jgi:aminoglycoside 6'-N-acetyltransferase
VGDEALVLRGERVLLRPIRDEDVAPIAAILAEPSVVKWWGEHDQERTRRELLEDPDCETFVIERDGDVIGLVLVSEENDPQYRSAGLDISLATAHQGQGLGREALALAIDHLVKGRGHHRITIDPAAENEIAIRCYRALGFKPVGIMRQYERAPDGSWRDGLLMDLLADERGSQTLD